MAVKNTKTKKTSTAKKSATSRGRKSSSSKDYLGVSDKNLKKGRAAKATSKTNRNTNTKRTVKSNAQKPAKTNPGVNSEILAIITLVLGVFFAVAMHTSLTGFIGEFIGNFFRGMFGIIGYFIPYMMIFSAVMVFLKREKPFTKKHMICMLVIFCMLNLINSERYLENFSFSTANISIVYSMGNQLMGAGILGMYSGKLIETAIGPVGIYLFSIATILIAVLIASDITLAGAFKVAKEKKQAARVKREEKLDKKDLNDIKYIEQRADQSFNKIKTDSVPDIDYISNSDAQRRQNMKEKLETNRRRHNILSLVKNEIFHEEVEKPIPETPSKKDDVIDDSLNKLFDMATVDKETGEVIDDAMDFSSLRDENQELQINISGMNVDDYKEPRKEHCLTEKDALNNLEKQQKSSKKTESNADKKEREKSQIEIQEDIENKKNQASRYEIEYKMPDLGLLNKPEYKEKSDKDLENLRTNAEILEKTLKSFNVDAKVINVTKGSSVTRYEVQPAVGTKVSSIVRLSDDIALNLRAKSIRMEAPIPGKAAVGIEIENESREMVTISEMVGSEEFKHTDSKLSFVVGKDIAGNTVVADLAKMPHMLIAGATGSGKSVCINTIITSILYNANPNEVKLLLIDPKMVELGNYNGIPHLLIPVVTDSNKAAAALNWAVSEMTGRYKKFAENSVREIKGYNKLMKKNGTPEEVMPQIVIVIDELADLMMVASSLVEEAICRLAQLARAAGIHLIVATQRPSVDVVTGLIKANIPSRIAFMVSSQVDSRTIIDMPGAEKLVGNGDMLFKPQNLDKPIRVQGPFISDEEVENIIEFIKAQNLEVDYDQDVIKEIKNKDKEEKNVADSDDVLMEDAIRTVIKAKQASVSMLQRRFRIGYNRAARIVDDMEMAGIVGPQDGSRPRSVLVDESYFDNEANQNDQVQVDSEIEDKEKVGLED